MIRRSEYRLNTFKKRSVLGGALFLIPERGGSAKSSVTKSNLKQGYTELFGCSAPRKYLQQTLLTDSGRPSDLKHNFCSASVREELVSGGR